MFVRLFNRKFLFGWAFNIKFLIFSLFVCLFKQKFLLCFLFLFVCSFIVKFLICSLPVFVCLLGSWSRAANLRAPEFFWSTNCRNWKSGRENRGLSSIRILSRSRMSSPGKDLQSKYWRRMVYYIDVKILCKILCNIEENTLLVEKLENLDLFFFNCLFVEMRLSRSLESLAQIWSKTD